MKINKEDFDKLNQLDRIEYRQKMDYITTTHGKSRSIQDMKFYMIMLSAIILLAFVALENGATRDVFNKIVALGLMASFYIIFRALIIDIYELFLLRKLRTKVENDYFKIEIKHGKRK